MRGIQRVGYNHYGRVWVLKNDAECRTYATSYQTNTLRVVLVISWFPAGGAKNPFSD